MRFFRAFVYIVTMAYSIALFTLTHTHRPPGIGVNLGDKAAHFLGYGALTGLFYMTFWVALPRRRWSVLGALPMALLYGAMDEITQPLVGRTCELADWLADGSGAAVAVGGWELLRLVAGFRRGAAVRVS